MLIEITGDYGRGTSMIDSNESRSSLERVRLRCEHCRTTCEHLYNPRRYITGVGYGPHLKCLLCHYERADDQIPYLVSKAERKITTEGTSSPTRLGSSSLPSLDSAKGASDKSAAREKGAGSVGWLRRKQKIPSEMIQLKLPPLDNEGAPSWTPEIEGATHKLGQEFVAPFIYEISPGQCLGGVAAKAVFQTSIRMYEARAALIQRKNDDFRMTTLVTAPGVTREQTGDYPWLPFGAQYGTSVPKEDVRDIVRRIRQLCEESHHEELAKRRKIRDDLRCEGTLAEQDVSGSNHPEHCWGEIARKYNRDNMRQFNLLLVQALNTAQEFEKSPEMIAFFARVTCAIAVGLRSITGIDLSTLSFPLQEPPLPPSHPLVVLLPFLDEIIEVHLKWLADAKSGDPLFPINYAKFKTALVWKAYLFLLNTPSANWGTSEFCALKVLRAFSTADHDAVVGELAKNSPDVAVREHVRPADWPPREFIRIYFEHRDRIIKFEPIVQHLLSFS